MRIAIDPVTRIEGHLSISLDIEDGRVKAAYCGGTMFRGFEAILQGRDPLDAIQITQRICGVCPADHAVASSLCVETALGITPPDNGRLLRNLVLGASFVQSHILHFYQLAALDFVDVAAVLKYEGKDQQLLALRGWAKAEVESNKPNAVGPFLPRFAGDYIADLDTNLGATKHYLQALHMHRLGLEMQAIFGGKAPHISGLVPGGVAKVPSVDTVEAFRSRLHEIKAFIADAYLPDVVSVAQAYPQYFDVGRGPGNLLSYGVFPEDNSRKKPLLAGGLYRNGSVSPLDPSKIKEDAKYSWASPASGLHPSAGQTAATPNKPDAYSWVKAPRYDGLVVEVGPLARVLITHTSGTNPALSSLVNASLRQLDKTPEALFSVMGRHLARALECKIIADACEAWLDQLKIGVPASARDYRIPESGQGFGLSEAARGALGHWMGISKRVISQYSCVVPTTWNCSPRDDQGQPGAVEQALTGVVIADKDNPIEAVRVVRAYDPCLACAVH